MTARLGVHYVAEPRPRRYDPNEHLSRRHLPGKHNQKTHGGHGAAGAGIHPATARELDDKVDQLQAKDPAKYWMVSKTHQGAKGYAINADDGSRKGYVALYEHDGGKTVEIGTLVAEPGSRGVVADAMKATDDLHPNAKQKLDCFDGHLPTIYAKHGFVETGRVKWDDQYAPDVWKPEYGRPDVVFMERPPAVERRSRANGATHHYDARHLPGKHNQKTHGGKGGAREVDGDYKPGNWHEAAPTRPKGTFAMRNGNAIYEESGVPVPASQRKEILDTIDRLYAANPPPTTDYEMKVFAMPLTEGTLAMTLRGQPAIFLDTTQMRNAKPESDTHFMPAHKKVSMTEYITTHEWGHVIDTRESGQVNRQWAKLNATVGDSHGSGYSHSRPEEMFAEMFAEFSITRGKTTNELAQAYAKEEGWTA